MKNSFFLLAFIFLSVLYSCNKEKAEAGKVHSPQTLPGSWELRSYYGGYGPTGGGDFEPGNGSIYTFTDDSYVYYSEGNPHDSGTYKLTTAPNPNTGENMSAIIFNGNESYPMCYSIKDDELILYYGPLAADGTVDTYVRITNAGEDINHQ